ncbi:MafI family immunity protein [Dryocola sp. BD613]|uniref:MafI family immunity protein n=1 Tax=Dryocola sp. BD613 TaxID=3133272 RepID=UPI003F4FB060
MNFDNEIIKLGEGLKDRLDPSLIDFTLDYISHSETILAFETLCDYIADYEVKVNKDEYGKIIHIANGLGLAITSRYTYIDPEKI